MILTHLTSPILGQLRTFYPFIAFFLQNYSGHFFQEQFFEIFQIMAKSCHNPIYYNKRDSQKWILLIFIQNWIYNRSLNITKSQKLKLWWCDLAGKLVRNSQKLEFFVSTILPSRKAYSLQYTCNSCPFTQNFTLIGPFPNRHNSYQYRFS